VLDSSTVIAQICFPGTLRPIFSTESTAPCNGDSGGALVIKRRGIHYVRGIVSVSVSVEDDPNICNADYPVLFTDVAKYRGWIKAIVDRELS
jgi:secreted trypsin-like serine protease